MQSFEKWFRETTKHEPHQWQRILGEETECRNRLIRIPTGMGKTLGVLAAWLYHRVGKGDDNWPLRFVWCLPMRVLVEQTFREAEMLLKQLGVLWEEELEDHNGRVGLHLLMGGEDDGNWRYNLEHPAILIGTQDMLLSRALNRGYGSPRGRWPMEYALLHNDALWVMDEVQLMDVGLATSVQLQAFREGQRQQAGRLSFTWWMSATLQADWLNTRDFKPLLPPLRQATLQVGPSHRSGALWEIQKPCRMEAIPLTKDDAKADRSLADRILELHNQSTQGPFGRITLAIVNTVDRARALFAALDEETKKSGNPPGLHLIHSRFRGLEKKQWGGDFLHKKHCTAGADRIIVATQVVEAGVDISATVLVTELAPWPSLVQRFGRAARYGGTARILVVDRELTEKKCLPYDHAELTAAAGALARIDDVSITSLEEFEEGLSGDELVRLYPYQPLHLLSRRENDELFDTGVDLTGGDLDISRFIRGGEGRDLSIFWAEWDEKRPPADLRPKRDGLCNIPIGEAASWLGKQHLNNKAWLWDYLENTWVKAWPNDLRPGITLLVKAGVGGYDPALGFTGQPIKPKARPMEWRQGVTRTADRTEDGDRGQDREDLSAMQYPVTIATHGWETARAAANIADTLALSAAVRNLLELAACLHDWGKIHIAFQSNIQEGVSDDLAKAPKQQWKATSQLYVHESCGKRRGFRHELVTVCALFELLARHDRNHPALLGPYREYIEAGVLSVPREQPIETNPLAAELAALSKSEFNLLTYLVCAHHGKVRASWQATPHDQDFRNKDNIMGEGQPLRGVREGDTLPSCRLTGPDGRVHHAPALSIHLDPAALGLSDRYGESWSERCTDLRNTIGAYRLALLETVLRVADARASALRQPDPLLEGGNA